MCEKPGNIKKSHLSSTQLVLNTVTSDLRWSSVWPLPTVAAILRTKAWTLAISAGLYITCLIFCHSLLTGSALDTWHLYLYYSHASHILGDLTFSVASLWTLLPSDIEMASFLRFLLSCFLRQLLEVFSEHFIWNCISVTLSTSFSLSYFIFLLGTYLLSHFYIMFCFLTYLWTYYKNVHNGRNHSFWYPLMNSNILISAWHVINIRWMSK